MKKNIIEKYQQMNTFWTLVFGFILGTLFFSVRVVIASRMSIISIFSVPPYMVARLAGVLPQMFLYGVLGALVLTVVKYLTHSRQFKSNP